MLNEEVCARISDIGVIPALRVSSADEALLAAEAVALGGIPIVEVTMTVPGALDVIAILARERPEILTGAGTVLEAEAAKRCIDAGAQFLTSTGFDPEVTRIALDAGLLVIPGVLTPSEVLAARKAGASFVKIFPCHHVGGASYIKTLRAPFPDIPMIAAGGVNHGNVAEFFAAGATAVGVGAHLIPRKAIELMQPNRITELARRLKQQIRQSRSPGA